MKVGFIGTGSMGSLLIDAFIRSGALQPQQIRAANRTRAKAERLAIRHPGLQAVASNLEAVLGCELVFLCVKPLEYRQVLDEIKASMQPEQMIVSITSPVLLAQLEDMMPCKVAKMIPSITNDVFSGVVLCTYGSRASAADCERLEALLGSIGRPLQIDEAYTRIASDLSSCGPAFFAFLLQKYIDAAVEETGIAREEASRLASSMLLGTGKLLTDGALSPEQLQARVSVPGGITAKALRMLDTELDGVFNRLIRTTHAKFAEDVEKVGISLYGEKINGS
ncbi:late competence protein ComER [Paenibacillus sp. IB182496]|uniref:Pyrroline-5-carboxylate reductase n=1 Tax=Paenibacillus sabuli TaxID=2772509 RepID=A0A927GR86_9BACL|nr:late competence protein ComER [Paenibacillus sabuli]MBD2844487.1 late competence protein ComER [Paenibacillus sabuli]